MTLRLKVLREEESRRKRRRRRRRRKERHRYNSPFCRHLIFITGIYHPTLVNCSYSTLLPKHHRRETLSLDICHRKLSPDAVTKYECELSCLSITTEMFNVRLGKLRSRNESSSQCSATSRNLRVFFCFEKISD